MQPLGSIKKWLGHKKTKKTQAAPSTNDTPDKTSSEMERSYLQNDIAIVSGFTPQTKGTEATLQWLERRTPDAVSNLLNERDRAAKQNARGPKNKGTKEVKQILLKPCRKTVEQLHNVRNQAEATVKYGAAGAVVFSLGKSLSRNSGAPKLPSLQLKDFSTMVREQLEQVSKLPGSALNSTTISPRSWLYPRTPREPSAVDRGAVSGGKRDSERPASRLSFRGESTGGTDEEADQEGDDDDDDNRASPIVTDSDSEEEDFYDNPPDIHTAEEEWGAREATFVSIIQVQTQNVRKVHINRRRQGEWRPMPKIREVSPLPLPPTPEGVNAGR